MPRGRPRKTPLTTKALKNTPQVIEKVITTDISVRRIKVWDNVPSELSIDETTPIGTRVVYAEYPEARYFLKRFIRAGAHDEKTGYLCPNGGIVAESNILDYAQFLRPASVIIHSGGEVKEAIPEEFKNFTGGHRAGTAAAERAARKEMKRQIRLKKQEERNSRKEARKEAKEKKFQAKMEKKRLREEKRQAKLLRKKKNRKK